MDDMNDVQLRPMEQRLKLYKAIASGNASFDYKGERLAASVVVDKRIHNLKDLEGEIDWILSQIPQLEEYHYRLMDILNSFCIRLEKKRETYTDSEKEVVECQKAEIVRVKALVQGLKKSEQLLQAMLMKHRFQRESSAAGGGKAAKQKLDLSKKDSEDLNRKIVKVVNDYQDKFSLEESLRRAATNSRKHFLPWIKIARVTNLTKPTIEGRYRRNRDNTD